MVYVKWKKGVERKGRGKYTVIAKMGSRYVTSQQSYKTKATARKAISTPMARAAQKRNKVKNIRIVKVY